MRNRRFATLFRYSKVPHRYKKGRFDAGLRKFQTTPMDFGGAGVPAPHITTRHAERSESSGLGFLYSHDSLFRLAPRPGQVPPTGSNIGGVEDRLGAIRHIAAAGRRGADRTVLPEGLERRPARGAAAIRAPCRASSRRTARECSQGGQQSQGARLALQVVNDVAGQRGFQFHQGVTGRAQGARRLY